MTAKNFPTGCGRIHRRTFLADAGMGFTGLALSALLQRDGVVRADEKQGDSLPGQLHFLPKAKSVIWLFMFGGVSHLESFDPKPAVTKYAGKMMSETPFADALESPLVKDNTRQFAPNNVNARIQKKLYPLQIGYRRRGQSGIEVSDWFPHVGGVIDDIAVIRSLWCTDNDHSAALEFHTGRHPLDGFIPTVGAWTHYGLGSLNENLPQFVVLGPHIADQYGGAGIHGADYLGPEHDGVPISGDVNNPLPFARPASGASREEQALSGRLLGRLNRLSGIAYPDDPALRARIKSYELAFKMQTSVPEVVRYDEEDEATRKLYGLDQDVTKDFGRLCLTARRLVERGVRFVQVYNHGKGPQNWDAHSQLKKNHTVTCAQVDQPTAALLKDLKQRGMLEETMVVFCTEFGRTPGVEAGQKGEGRDHHNFGFSSWLAGGGIRGGVVHGATDELGFHAVENRHYVTDIHATVLQQLGLDAHRLQVPGRQRLEIEVGRAIDDIIV